VSSYETDTPRNRQRLVAVVYGLTPTRSRAGSDAGARPLARGLRLRSVESLSAEQQPLQPFAVRAVVRRAAPRLVRDAFGPLAIFFVGWKTVGLSVGIIAAMIFGAAVYAHERRSGRPAMIVRVALLFVLIRGVVGLSSNSAHVYLAIEIGIDALIGCTVLGLLARGRPLAAMFADEVFPLPKEMSESDTFMHAMRVITAVWGVYFIVRSMVRLAALLTLTTDGYVLVASLSDAPFLIGLLAWSVHYTTKAFRNSSRWAPVLASAEPLQARLSSEA
jgi:intracellular septation protein A